MWITIVPVAQFFLFFSLWFIHESKSHRLILCGLITSFLPNKALAISFFILWVLVLAIIILCPSIFQRNLNLVKLLYFGFKSLASHLLVECSQLKVMSLILRIDFDPLSKPTRNLVPIALIGVSLIEEKYRSIILSMSNYTTNSLVNWSSSLLIVPIFACKTDDLWIYSGLDHSSVIKELLFKDNFWICHLWVWYSYNDHTSSSFVWEVKPFTYSTAANSHQDCTSTIFIFKYFLVIHIHNRLVFLRVLWFPVNNFMPLDFIKDTGVCPDFISLFH